LVLKWLTNVWFSSSALELLSFASVFVELSNSEEIVQTLEDGLIALIDFQKSLGHLATVETWKETLFTWSDLRHNLISDSFKLLEVIRITLTMTICKFVKSLFSLQTICLFCNASFIHQLEGSSRLIWSDRSWGQNHRKSSWAQVTS